MSSSLCILMGSLLANFKIRKLAFRTWLPYDYSTASAFLLAFAYQIVVATVCTFACVASDTLYSGLLIHISCQFEILEHRLKNIGSDKNYSMKQCVRHHNHIYKLVCQFTVNFDKLSNIYTFTYFGTLQIWRDGERCISIDHVLSILHESVNDLFQFLPNNANRNGFEIHRDNPLHGVLVNADILLLLVQQRSQAQGSLLPSERYEYDT